MHNHFEGNYCFLLQYYFYFRFGGSRFLRGILQPMYQSTRHNFKNCSKCHTPVSTSYLIVSRNTSYVRTSIYFAFRCEAEVAGVTPPPLPQTGVICQYSNFLFRHLYWVDNVYSDSTPTCHNCNFVPISVPTDYSTA